MIELKKKTPFEMLNAPKCDYSHNLTDLSYPKKITMPSKRKLQQIHTEMYREPSFDQADSFELKLGSRSIENNSPNKES